MEHTVCSLWGMSGSGLARVLTAVLATVGIAVGCGGNESVDTVEPADQQAADTTVSHGDHDTADIGHADHSGHDHDAHGSLREVADGVAVPTLAIQVHEDPVEGWNLRLDTTDFRMAPERVSTAHVDGEGHAHLYIDGVKVSRVYGHWHHIGALAAGEHELRVELSANDHSTLAVGGVPIEVTTTVVAPEPGDQSVGHVRGEARAATEPHPLLELRIVDDPAGGWNINAVPSNFRLAPQNVSGDHVDGEGYMRLYIGGEEVARLYETWYEMPPLPAGSHEIRVELRSNDHAPITVDDVVVQATATLRSSGSEGSGADAADGSEHGSSEDGSTADSHHHDHEHDHEHDHGVGAGDHSGSHGGSTRYDADIADVEQTVTIEVAGGDPVGGVQRIAVDRGSVVALMVTADTAEEVHVHGYDILRAVSPGQSAHFAFTAEIPGVFEVELERSGRLLLQLQIS